MNHRMIEIDRSGCLEREKEVGEGKEWGVVSREKKRRVKREKGEKHRHTKKEASWMLLIRGKF